MAYTHPDSLTLATSDVLQAGSHWNPLKENFKSLLTDPSTFGLIKPQSGATVTGSMQVLGRLDVSSELVVPGSVSVGAIDATSGFSYGGAFTQQLLQRVHVFDTTSRASASAVFSVYTVASITPVHSRSTLLIRAGYTGLSLTPNADIGIIHAHLARNPTVAASIAYLTDSSNVSGSALNFFGGGAVAAYATVFIERVDSASNLFPKQYGINWNHGGTGTTAITNGFITIEEWL